MPELPEVETIRRCLEPVLVGKTITGVRFLWPKTAHGIEPDQFAALLTGQTIDRVERRGKFLLLRFASGATLGIHLRMTGQLAVKPGDKETGMHDRMDEGTVQAGRSGQTGRSQEKADATRAVLSLNDGNRLCFSDIRKFGRFYWVDVGECGKWDDLGPEPLDGLDLPAFSEIISRRKNIKAILLDQSLIAGVGNIYTDESLFRAGIHPGRQGIGLSGAETERLYHALLAVLAESIANRGTTYRDYVDGEGRPGGFQERLAVYGRAGSPCTQCGALVERTVISNRGTHYCPTCQRMMPGGN